MTFETVKQFLEDVSILYPTKVYLGEDNLLKIGKAYPYRTMYITGADDDKKVVGDPELREPELEYIEKNCQTWIVEQMEEGRRRAEAKAEEASKIRKVLETIV